MHRHHGLHLAEQKRNAHGPKKIKRRNLFLTLVEECNSVLGHANWPKRPVATKGPRDPGEIMRMRCRPSTAGDFKNWLQHSTVRSRYGPLFGQLPGIWASLLSKEEAISSVIEDLDAPKNDRLLCLGLTVFLSDEFARQAKISPLFWIGPELVRRIEKDESPILDSAAIRRGNSCDGLNLFVWEIDIRPVPKNEFLAIATDISNQFFKQHAGFKIKDVMAQHPFGPVLRAGFQVGGWLFHDGKRDYAPLPRAEEVEAAGLPFILGSNRELARKFPGSWISTLFDYREPRIFFAPSEQTLLLCALEEHTDDHIGRELAISSSAVKKCWQSIYARVSLRLPELLPEDGHNGGGRGTEKKRRLLAYVRTHPEELRPLLALSSKRGEGLRAQRRVKQRISVARNS
jgi:hypothetical protein